MFALLKYEFKKLYHRREIWVLLILSIGIAVAALYETTSFSMYITDQSTALSAIEASMLYLSGLGRITMLCLVPLFCAIITVNTYWDENKNRSIIAVITRTSFFRYHISKLIVVTITSFVISIFPFIINLIMCLIACPLHSFISQSSVYSSNFFLSLQYDLDFALFRGLYANQPILDAFAHIFLIGIYGIGMALFTYALSLYYHKSRILVISAALVFGVVVAQLFNALKLKSLVIYDYFIIMPIIKDGNIFTFLIYMCVFISLILSFISYKLISRNKDIII
jgi:hypothetical protein